MKKGKSAFSPSKIENRHGDAQDSWLICPLGELGGIALGLSISGATFVNTALSGLQKILPYVPRQQLQAAIAGTSSEKHGILPYRLRPLAFLWAHCRRCMVVCCYPCLRVPTDSRRFILVYVAGAVSLLMSLFLSVSVSQHNCQAGLHTDPSLQRKKLNLGPAAGGWGSAPSGGAISGETALGVWWPCSVNKTVGSKSINRIIR